MGKTPDDGALAHDEIAGLGGGQQRPDSRLSYSLFTSLTVVAGVR